MVKNEIKTLDHRTRFMNCLRGLEIDRLPFIEMAGAPWAYSYVQRWDLQGVPLGSDPRLFFGFDCADVSGAEQGFEKVPVDWYAVPRFPEYALPDEGEYKRRIDGRWGRARREVPSADPAHPIEVRIFEDTRVRSRADWLEFKKRFRHTPEGRYPEDWERWTAHSKMASHPIALELMGLFSAFTNVLGWAEETGMYVSFYDRPEFVHEIIDHFTELNLTVSEKALAEARVDFVKLGDQIAGDDRPFISPKQMEQFFLPGYRRMIDHLRNRGVEVIIYNADGNVLPFVPMLVDIGIDGLMGLPRPMDMAGLRARYGNALCMIGGIDRWVLLKSKEEIEREVDHTLALARKGRVIPCLNASILPETPLENYRHYAEYLRSNLTVPLYQGMVKNKMKTAEAQRTQSVKRQRAKTQKLM